MEDWTLVQPIVSAAQQSLVGAPGARTCAPWRVEASAYQMLLKLHQWLLLFQVEYLWTSQDLPSWAAIPTNYRVKNLVVPAPLANTQPQAYKLRLTANFKGSSQVATADVTMTAIASSLVAALKGPAGDVRSSSTIVLDASSSRDPDDPKNIQPLTYTWDCQSDKYPEACFDSADQGQQADGKWTFSAGLLDEGSTYTFTVTVSKDTRR